MNDLTSRGTVDGRTLRGRQLRVEAGATVEHWCPVGGCPAANRERQRPWRTLPALRAHVDSHLLGVLPGSPSKEWLLQHRWVTCGGCNRLLGANATSGWHRKCWAQQQRTRIEEAEDGTGETSTMDAELNAQDVDDLPTFEEISMAAIRTIEHAPAATCGIIEIEYRRLMANVVLYNRPDAWDDNVMQDDAIVSARARAKVAWTELWMFPKTCLMEKKSGGGGQRRQKRALCELQNRLERWQAGERRGLWDEALCAHEDRTGEPPAKKRSEKDVEKNQQQQAVKYAGLGMPAKAVMCLTTKGMAPADSHTEATMRAKFPEAEVIADDFELEPAPQANEVSLEAVRVAVASMARGTAPGPSGLRPDLVRQLLERGSSATTLSTLTLLVNLMLDGQAPRHIAPWIAGAAGHAFQKKTKLTAQAAAANTERLGVRPVCCGEALRRIACKALLATETQVVADFLAPWQLAVGVRGGAEAAVHAAREWMADNQDDAQAVVLDFDETNAYNMVHRTVFLQRMHAVCPGMSRWLRWIYPYDDKAWVIWDGKKIPSGAGGHQGCPLMGLCHAAVQRCIPESLGLAKLWPGTTHIIPVMDPPPAVSLMVMFADDGLIGGGQTEMARVAAHLTAHMPRNTGLSFGKMQAVPASKNNAIDGEAMKAAGCTMCAAEGFEVMRAPIGQEEWAQDYSRHRVEETMEVIEALAKLPSRHTGFYLARYQAGRTNYVMRTTPRGLCHQALKAVDGCTRALVQGWVGGTTLSEEAWTQTCLPQRLGGLGLPACENVADAAYMASRLQAQAKVVQLIISTSEDQRLETDLNDRWYNEAKIKLDTQTRSADEDTLEKLPMVEEETNEGEEITQRALSAKICRAVFSKLWANASGVTRCNLEAQCAMGTGAWLTPPPTVDGTLNETQFAGSLAIRLGVPPAMAGTQRPCRFCGMPRDELGWHDMSCMSGGDAVRRHNQVRDVIYDMAKLAQTSPTIEEPGLLSTAVMGMQLRRPADVLVHLARTGGEGDTTIDAFAATEKVAVDVKVVNACGRSHAWTAGAPNPHRNLTEYETRAGRLKDTAAVCAAHGVRYYAAAFSAQGGRSPAADALLHNLARLIELHNGTPAHKTHQAVVERISSILQIAGSRARARRGGWHETSTAEARHQQDAEFRNLRRAATREGESDNASTEEGGDRSKAEDDEEDEVETSSQTDTVVAAADL